ncbi:MAG TPA: hypothetical protein VEH83_00345, partial [Gemmatimonadales bacterium]|nr:hypothetical protein [Gemmatimonadales bacterium]
MASTMRARAQNAKGGPEAALQRWYVAVYWQVGAPSFSPVTGGVALPTKIPQVFAVALLLDVALQPVPV